MSNNLDLTNQNISETYQRILQTDNGIIFDGVGNTFSLGISGSQGPQGFQGPRGDLGIYGPQGFQGPRGDLGIYGPQGLIGPQGLLGPQGLQGLFGPQGFGIQGPQGPSNESLNLDNLEIVRTSKDSDGIFTNISWYYDTGNLARTSILSGTGPTYDTNTIRLYATDGISIVQTRIFSLIYDSDGDFLHRNLISIT